MLKFVTILFNAVALLIYNLFFVDPVTVTQNVPASAKPGSEFIVELTINKEDISGFAKLQQELPEGFTAVEDDNNGASFTFVNQSVKFIWMALPATKTFKVKYKVKVAEGQSGEKTIAGKFSYVVDNVKQSVDIPSATVVVTGDAAPAAVAAAAPPVVTSTKEVASVVCSRNIIDKTESGFVVEVLVNKGNIVGFGKLIESLPEGFKATEMSSQQASFTFVDQKVKLVWVTIPTQTEFKISYKVSVDPTLSGDQSIDGTFSYFENDETKKVSVPATVIPITATATTLAQTTTPEPVAPAAITAAPVSEPVPTPPVAVEQEKPAPAIEEKALAATSIPTPQSNVNYSVQIAALHKAVSADALAERYGLNARINTEMAEGFTKYTVGSHKEYKEARDAREQVKSKGVKGPFVAAYNNGKRITVQEAIMITSQKWYR